MYWILEAFKYLHNIHSDLFRSLTSQDLRCHRLSSSKIASISRHNFAFDCWYLNRISSSNFLDWRRSTTIASSSLDGIESEVGGDESMSSLSAAVSKLYGEGQSMLRKFVRSLVNFFFLVDKGLKSVFLMTKASSPKMLNLSNLCSNRFLSLEI